MQPIKTNTYNAFLLNSLKNSKYGSKTFLVKAFLVKASACMAALICLGACSTSKLAALQNEPGYLAGFSDGCQTAREAEKSFSTKRVRDDYAFSEDESYQLGWRAGLQQCNYPNDDITARGGRIFGEDANF